MICSPSTHDASPGCSPPAPIPGSGVGTRTAPRGLPLIAALAGAGLLVGCGGGGTSTPPTTPTTSAPAATATPATAAPSGTPAAVPSPAASPTIDVRVITVAVAGGQVQGASGDVDVTLGQRVRIEVSADVSDEVHVHGYDVVADVTPDRPAVLELEATIPGAFEVELEDAGLVLFRLRAAP